MPLPTASFLVGLAVTAYLGTFVIFAVVRIATGVSIQRVGYSGLRRIALSPRDGIKIHVRGLGFSVHRPTFAQPTWISLNLTEPQATIDLRALGAAKRSDSKQRHYAETGSPTDGGTLDPSPSNGPQEGRWKQLTKVKEKLKRLHRYIKWMKMVDIVITGARVTIQDVGVLQVERLTLAVDTRAQTVDRTRLFQHHKEKPDTKFPAEWKSIVRSVLFSPDGQDSVEILDHCSFTVHGFLHSQLEGLRDASIALKLGRLTVPYDCLAATNQKVKNIRSSGSTTPPQAPAIAINDVPVEAPASLDDKLVETVASSKEFITSLLRGVQEFQLAVGSVGFSKRIQSLHTPNKPLYFNLAMKEVGFDLTRLDPRSPAHRMYFLSRDVAHQALLTAISISAGVGDGQERPEKMLYVPMITATVKTTLPSKTVHYVEETDAGERNSNILFANFVCTSPSLDLDPKHLPLLLAIAKPKKASGSAAHKPSMSPRGLVSRLLPKAIIKMAIQEPVIRVALPPLNPSGNDTDYDLLISSTSTIAMDVEAQHTMEKDSEPHYALAISYRQTSQSLYYQSNAGEKHDLLLMDTAEVKVDVNALPETTVHTSARFQSFSVFLVRPEISEGIRQIVKALRKSDSTNKKSRDRKKSSFLRQIPAWLEHVNVQGSDFNVELAGTDFHVSKYSRGFALQLASWSAEYKAHRDENLEYIPRRRSRSISRSISRPRGDRSATPVESPRRKPSDPSDGRRLAIHIQGLEGFIIDSVEDSVSDPFVTLPRFEVAFSTSTDVQGRLFHINSHAKSLQIQYSIYNHFAIGVAILTFRRMFMVLDEDSSHTDKVHHPSATADPTPQSNSPGPAADEVTTIDFKANLVQVKAKMPADPPLMFQVFGIDAGRHRWANPFTRAKVMRLYAGTPGMLSVWSRIVSIRGLRLDLREMRYKHGKQIVEEKSIDVSTDAVRLGVPHGLVLHSIFDNIVNVVKTTAQMHHHFQTGSDEYILAKHSEGPKKVPRISIRSQVLLFEIEDSPFEWKLGTIYRAGLIEQQQRIAREEAFRIKVKKMETSGQRRGSSRLRASSAQPSSRSRSHSRQDDVKQRRSKSQYPPLREDSPEGGSRGRGRRMRYNAEGKCEMSGTSHLGIEQAHQKLQKFNAESWRKRIDRALQQQTRTMKGLRGLLWGIDGLPEEAEQNERVMSVPQRPALMSAIISDLGVIIDKPSFPLGELPKFLHDIGKGMPMNMEYGLLVPMNLRVTMGEARFGLRDYPLPFLHVPATRVGQSPRLPSLSLSTDFVVAEEFQGPESERHVNIVVCPEDKLGKDDKGKKFAIDVRRTISAVKTYSDMKVEINTSAPTIITWGTSYQPAIQDMMQVIENFTKPPMDPSERVGFWDKIRLSFHSRIDVAWKGDGDVHLCLKGSRNPYVVTGNGAGFVMVWRNNVRWRLAQDPDPRKFMSVESGDYLLAIPDFNHYARMNIEDDSGDGSGSSSTSSAKSTAAFKKVVMKLSGNVRWMAGLMFERDLDDGKRTFDFCPHYKVFLKHPDYAKAPPGKEYDAFRTFRSHHIHMSIAVAAPHDRDWNVSNLQPSTNYNSVHLTPRFFKHFFDWWSLFSGIMSLPVRQGPLWGNVEKSSKKFGRHLATIKYNLLFSPLFISHIYKHKDAEDYESDVVSATGLKMKLDSFMLDLHQRRETFEIPGHGDAKPKRTSQMKINQSQLDFISADIRAVSATITGTRSKDIDEADDESLSAYQSPLTSKVDMSKFTIPDNDFTWIDMDDFVELDWILPAESNPETKILPLTYGPRFTYFRQTDHGDSVSGDPTRTSPFGDEPTHFCVMSKKNDPRRVQADLIQTRLARINEQIANNERAVGEQELKVVRDRENAGLAERLDALRNHTEALEKKHSFLDKMLKILMHRLEQDDPSLVPTLETVDDFPNMAEVGERTAEQAKMDATPLADYASDFNNRFVVHNPQIKWNNSLRNIILRYIHQVSQRRGFVYYMSRRAVKFILDTVEERQKGRSPSAEFDVDDVDAIPTTPGSPEEDDAEIQERIDELLRDGKQFVSADDPERQGSGATNAESDADHDMPMEYLPQNTYHFRLIAPQIQLQSEKNPKAVILITAKGMQFKVLQIMDKDRVMDEVSGLVQRRFSANMDGLQIFVTSTKTFSTEYLHMYSGNHYGGKTSEYWPPWVPLEVMFEFAANPYGFNRVVHRTSASLRFDKYNNLRLKYNDNVSGGGQARKQGPDSEESRMDHIWIEFPHFRAICDSNQYYAMYIIALDLLLYSEPLEKTRSERLEKIMLASDFSDLRGAPEMVEMLQHRIRQLEDIKMHFQINEHYLDRQGWKDRIAVDQDLTNCEDELFFIMKAITTSQRRIEDRSQQDASTGVLRWLISSKEIAWHLVREQSESLVEFQLRDAQFSRTENTDGSNYNCVEIGRINGFNLLHNAVYPEIIAPYIDPARGYHKQRDAEMLRVQWLQLEAIAGIQVVDYFEVNVMPLRVQLEREVAKKLFEYIFPGVGGSAFEGSGFSPFMIKNMAPPQEEDDEDAGHKPDTQEMSPTNGHHTQESNPMIGTGAGELEHRLQPTMTLPDRNIAKQKKPGLGGFGNMSHSSLPHWNLFQHSNKSQSSVSRKQNGFGNTPSNLSVLSKTPSDKSLVPSTASSSFVEEKKRPGTSSSTRKKEKDKEPPSDDLTQMMSRASNYMTLAFFKIPSTVLCLSYKGRGQRNLEDVHDLVFRLPTFEYRNKTWSNLDLALQIKKDMIKALISHTGAIIGNKFSHHRPSRQQAQSRLKEIANMSTLLSINDRHGDSEDSSPHDMDMWEDRPRPSFHSGRPSTLDRTLSHASSAYSLSKTKSATSSKSVTPNSTPLLDRPGSSASNGNNRPHTHAGETGHHLLPPPTTPWAAEEHTRNRSGSIGARLSTMTQKLRQSTDGPSAAEESEDGVKKKSKLILGGQKLLRSLPHASKSSDNNSS